KEAAWARYESRFPQPARRMAQKLAQAAQAARGREAIRSETTRLLAVARAFALRAGELSGLGEDVFYLWREELLAALRNAAPDAQQIAVRRAAHERHSSLPPYPAIIRGRFDPFSWAVDDARRSDIFDAGAVRGVDAGDTGGAAVR